MTLDKDQTKLKIEEEKIVMDPRLVSLNLRQITESHIKRMNKRFSEENPAKADSWKSLGYKYYLSKIRAKCDSLEGKLEKSVGFEDCLAESADLSNYGVLLGHAISDLMLKAGLE